jgi:hypothetical protein
MDRKCKAHDIQSWGKKKFLEISLIRLSHHLEVFCLLSHPLPHIRFKLFIISEMFATQL